MKLVTKLLTVGVCSALIALAACSDTDSSGKRVSVKNESTKEKPIEPVVPQQAPIQTTTVTKNVPSSTNDVTQSNEPPTRPQEKLTNESGAALEPSEPKPRTHIVKGVVTQWRPMILFVQPGDQIVFKQMIGHDTQTIEGMMPVDATPWQSKMGQEGLSVTLEKPGIYMYKCTPHVSLGMIGAIVVGDLPPTNLGEIEEHPQNKGMFGRAIRKLKKALDAKQGS